MYDMTNVTAANNLFEQVYYLNIQAHYLIGICLLIALFIVLIFTLKKYDQDTKETFVVSSTITAVIGVIIWTIGLIPFNVLIYPIIVLFASLMVYKFSE